jgi:hypothetical protein
MKPSKHELWKQRLFAEAIPAEVVLRIARAFVFDADPENQPLDQVILEWLAVESFRTGAHYKEISWPLRLLNLSLTGEVEQGEPKRPPKILDK